MKSILRYFLLVITLLAQSSCFAEALPTPIANGLVELEAFLDRRLVTTSRIEVMIIPPGIFIDPPATTATFPSVARVAVAMSGATAYDLTKLTIIDLRGSRWKISPAPRYPRWYWRVIDASGKVVIDFLIDEEGSAICYADIWYIVDRKPVNRLTREFVDFAARQMLLPPERRPGLEMRSESQNPRGSSR